MDQRNVIERQPSRSVESRMLGDGHVRFGRRLGETDRSKDPNRAPSRPHVVLCHTRQEALEVKARLARWLTPRGLALNDGKTRVVYLGEGFDFLGFNVRPYHGKLLIKPSEAAVRRIRERLRTELRSLRGFNAGAVIRKLNPIIRGWANNYYRTHVVGELFAKLDNYLWRLTFKCCAARRPVVSPAQPG